MKTIRNIYSERNFLFLLLHRVGETEAYELTSLLEAEHPNERVLNLLKIDQSTLGDPQLHLYHSVKAFVQHH